MNIKENVIEIRKISKEKHIFFINRKNYDSSLKKPALFLDRDGVIIEDVNYLSRPSEVKLLPGVKELLSLSSKLGWINIVITNQSGIFRGYFNWTDYENVTMKMIDLIGTPSSIKAIYANGSAPNSVLSTDSWRKPSPNMILNAAFEFNVDIENSILIGDRLTDLMSAQNSGIKTSFHVLTGHGRKERNNIVNEFDKSSKNNKLLFIDDLSSFPLNILLT